MQLNTKQRGDTIIEVILALAIFSLVTVSMFSIMQRGSLSAYDALERSQVRLMMNRQTELLTYIRDSYINARADDLPITTGSPAELWTKVTNTAVIPSVTEPAVDTCVVPSGAFYIRWDTSSGKYVLDSTIVAADGLPADGKGLWIVKSDPSGFSGKRRYHDFYVMSCWRLATTQDQMMSTIVRMHEPN